MEDCVFLYRIYQVREDAENVNDELWKWVYDETELYWIIKREDDEDNEEDDSDEDDNDYGRNKDGKNDDDSKDKEND